MAEWTVIIAPLGFALALYSAIRTELLRRSSDSESQRKEFQLLKNDVELLKMRLEPLFSVMAARLSSMFHADHDPWRLDALIDKYRDSPETLSDEDLTRLIRGMYAVYERVKRGGPEDNPASALAATLYLALLDGQRNVRRRQAREAESEPTPQAPWWRRWWTQWWTP